MAVIAVPAADVVDAARACAALGVRALVILSAGFAEIGDEGVARQRELLRGLPRGGHAGRRAELPRRR